MTVRSRTHQMVMADATICCGNGFNWPKESSSLWAGSELRAEMRPPPGEDRRAHFVSLARPFRYWLYPQTPTLTSSTPLPHREERAGPPPRKKPTPSQHCLVWHRTQGHGTGAFPAFLQGPEPRGRHLPPRVREGEQSSRGAAIHYLAYDACSIE